jgi:hypothetical protein
VIITFLVLILPFLARMIMITRPLEAGDIRKDLNEQSESVGVSYRDILIWDMGPGQINAAVMGHSAFSRFVLITRSLLSQFSIEEIKLVFWHELGHIVQKHLWFHYLYFISVPGLIMLFESFFDHPLESWQSHLILFTLWIMGFSWISQNLEKHADLYAIRKSSHPDHFLFVLGRISDSTGLSRKFYTLTHGSIEKRIQFLRQMIQHPEKEPAFQRKIRLIRHSLVFLFSFECIFWLHHFMAS